MDRTDGNVRKLAETVYRVWDRGGRVTLDGHRLCDRAEITYLAGNDRFMVDFEADPEGQIRAVHFTHIVRKTSPSAKIRKKGRR